MSIRELISSCLNGLQKIGLKIGLKIGRLDGSLALRSEKKEDQIKSRSFCGLSSGYGENFHKAKQAFAKTSKGFQKDG